MKIKKIISLFNLWTWNFMSFTWISNWNWIHSLLKRQEKWRISLLDRLFFNFFLCSYGHEEGIQRNIEYVHLVVGFKLCIWGLLHLNQTDISNKCRLSRFFLYYFSVFSLMHIRLRIFYSVIIRLVWVLLYNIY